MTTTAVDPNEILAPSLTMLDATRAIVAQILENHAFDRTVDLLSDPSAFDQLMHSCNFLANAIRDGITAEPGNNPAQSAFNIVTWLKANLYSEQLINLNTAVVSMTNQRPSIHLPDFVESTLERIRAAVDDINSADGDTENNALNGYARTVISGAAVKFSQASRMLSRMQANAARLANPTSAEQLPQHNQAQQDLILLDLEKLAYLLGKDEWATSHGFRKPSEP